VRKDALSSQWVQIEQSLDEGWGAGIRKTSISISKITGK